jgi:hypothetical protein
LRGVKPKSRDPWTVFAVAAPVGIILILILTQQRC